MDKKKNPTNIQRGNVDYWSKIPQLQEKETQMRSSKKKKTEKSLRKEKLFLFIYSNLRGSGKSRMNLVSDSADSGLQMIT